jgi:hypothetical protein
MLTLKLVFSTLIGLFAGCDCRSAASHTHDAPRLPSAEDRREGGLVAHGAEASKTVYVCPMHPEVTSDKPGICPTCNMRLEPRTETPGAAHSMAVPTLGAPPMSVVK